MRIKKIRGRVEKVSSALLSEKKLAKDWLLKEEDIAWKNL